MLFQFSHDVCIIGRVNDGCDIGVVLGRSADHRRAANVDILDGRVVVAALEADFLERIKIDDGKIDAANAVFFHGRDMFRVVAHGEQAAMDCRMQRLDAPIHDFRKAGDFGYVLHRNACGGNRFCCAAGREDFDAIGMKRLGEIDQAGFVGNGKEGAAHPMKIGSGNMLELTAIGSWSLRC